MDNIPEQLLDIVNELQTKNLKKFQWYLTIGVEGSKSIPKAQLENADTWDTVGKMVEQYGSNRAVEITLAILKKMNQNQLAEELRTKYNQADPIQTNTAQSAPGQTIIAQTGGSVIAPMLQGSVFYGAVNITFGKSSEIEGQAAPSTAQPELCANIPALTQDAHKKAESEQLKSIFRSQYSTLYEGTAAKGRHMDFNEIYTELYVVKDWRGGISTDHEIIQIEAGTMRRDTTDIQISFSDVFGDRDGKKVLTLGIAGIGKTVCVQKFVVDWAEGKSNADIDFVFLIPFRELNLLKDEQHSLHGLLDYVYPDLKHLKESGLYDNKCRCIFIFDGLDEMRKQLNFEQKKVTDIMKKTCVDVLVTNLITGALLPSASVWITSRPAAADQIHMKHINLMTEVQGFVTDQQKEEYFRKRISDQDQAGRIISHIRQSKTLHIMCYIPVFCWITATVLQEMSNHCFEPPKSLTEMYVHFLIIQMCTKCEKCHEMHQKDTKKLLESNRDMILKLAELAFKQLIKGNVMFYEEDLRECGIDVTDASVYSGICTEIFREESVLYQKKVYCFVHLSFQEFLAAFFVFHCYMNNNVEALQVFMEHDNTEVSDFTENQSENDPLYELNTDQLDEVTLNKSWYMWVVHHCMPCCRRTSKNVTQDFKPSNCTESTYVSLHELLEGAVYKTLKNQNGHLDLFLRFLLGISLESNQKLLQGLLPRTQSSSESITKTVMFIKDIMQEGYLPTEESINMFLCLNEVKDQSFFREIQQNLKPDKHAEKKLCATHCSAIAYMLQMSEEVLDELDTQKFNTSPEGRRRLFAAVCNSRRALLADCNLNKNCSEVLYSALKSANSPLRELDLHNDSLKDSVVELLSSGLKSSHCKLEILRITGSNLSVESCKSLTSVLQTKNSLKELVLNNNNLEDSGVEHLSAGLKSSQCKLEILGLAGCNLTVESCRSLTLALQTKSSLKELLLNNNYLEDSGVEELSAGLKSSHCKLEILRLTLCNLTEESCKSLTSALQTENSSLKELELNNNDLQDSGVEQLCAGLKRSPSKLEILRLSGCLVTEKGCSSLASALSSNPSQLKELDLTYNHPGASGVQLLSSRLKDPQCRLETLWVEHAGENTIRLGLRKYAWVLTLDPNTAHKRLALSEGNRKVTYVEEQHSYPDHPDRFDTFEQVLSKESLSGRCYWEAEWSGKVYIALTYKGILRKGAGAFANDCVFGYNEISWHLFCFNNSYSIRHNRHETKIPAPPFRSNRVGVYLDWAAGTLSFYSVSSDTNTLTHLRTFHSTFTESLYAGFSISDEDSSIHVCDIEKPPVSYRDRHSN